jgi:hypothetical protein
MSLPCTMSSRAPSPKRHGGSPALRMHFIHKHFPYRTRMAHARPPSAPSAPSTPGGLPTAPVDRRTRHIRHLRRSSIPDTPRCVRHASSDCRSPPMRTTCRKLCTECCLRFYNRCTLCKILTIKALVRLLLHQENHVRRL